MSQDTTVSLYEYDTDREFDATVEWSVSGGYLPATMTEPAEYPELEIESVTDDETGEDITETFKYDAWEIIDEMLRDGRLEG